MDPVETVRVRLLQKMNAEGLHLEDVAACVKKRSGERYQPRTIEFWVNNTLGRSGWEIALAVIRAWPRMGYGIVCPCCEHIISKKRYAP